MEVVANRANHEARFLINQESAFAALARLVNRAPQFQQIVQIPLQFRRAAANARRAGDDAAALRVLQLVHRLFQLGAVFAFNAARHTAAAWVVGHQHHIAACQADKGGQRSAFVAALFFFNLHAQLLAFANHVLNAGLAGGHIAVEVLFGNFFERQKTVTVFAVIDKAGL